MHDTKHLCTLKTTVALLAVTGIAAALRVHLFHHEIGGAFLAIGPDASDWVTTAMGLSRGDPTVFKPNRYLFVPWLAVEISRHLGLSPKEALLNLAFYSSLFLPAATLMVARRFVSLPAASLVAAWVVFKPEYISLSLSPIAYPVFCLAFVVAAGACVGAYGRAGAAVVVPAAFVASASLNQGMLCLLVMLPAGLLVGRWGTTLAAAFAGVGGLELADSLQPGRNDAFEWMLRETARYLGGNVAEETARTQVAYAETWLRWAELTFQVPRYLALALLVVAVIGFSAALFAPGIGRCRPCHPTRRRRDVPAVGAVGRRSVSSWLADPDRRAATGLVWAAAPLVVLLPLMASSHHLVHLEPLLGVGVALGIGCIPSRWGRLSGGVIVSGAIAFAFLRQDRTYRFEFQVDQARRELALGQRIGRIVGDEAILLAVLPPGPSPLGELWRAAWALPPRVALYVLPEGPLKPGLPVETFLEKRTPIWVVTVDERDRWISGPFLFVETAPPASVTMTVRNPGPAGRQTGTVFLHPAAVKHLEEAP